MPVGKVPRGDFPESSRTKLLVVPPVTPGEWQGPFSAASLESTSHPEFESSDFILFPNPNVKYSQKASISLLLTMGILYSVGIVPGASIF